MDADDRYYDDGEVSIRGHDVFYNASPQPSVDNDRDDLSDQISINSSHDDSVRPGHSQNVGIDR